MKKYTCADHLDEYPEIATRENLRALETLRASGWSNCDKADKVRNLANILRVPNNHHRNSQRALVSFLSNLIVPLHYTVILCENNITVGSKMFDSRVRKIGRDRKIYMENGSCHAPSIFDQEHKKWVSSLYKK